MSGVQPTTRPITLPLTNPLPAGKTLYERHYAQRAALGRKQQALRILRRKTAMSSPLSPLPDSPASILDSVCSDDISLMGHDEPPAIPQEILNSALYRSWADGSLQDEVFLMTPGQGNLGIQEHDSVRDDVRNLIPRLLPTQRPSLRTVFRHSTGALFMNRQYHSDPHNVDSEFETLSGKIDYGLYAFVPGTTQPLPSDIILVVEIKPATDGAVCPKQARAVDLQVRARANAARDVGVNKHFYLIGWVGCWFRPYYWFQDSSGEIETGIDKSRRPGVMRPSDSDLVISHSFQVPGPHVSLWRNIRTIDNQKLLQQVIRDAVRACDGTPPEYPEMYGRPCSTVSLMGRRESTERSLDLDASPTSDGSTYLPGRRIEVVPSSRKLRSAEG